MTAREDTPAAPAQDDVIKALSQELIARAHGGGAEPEVPLEETEAFKQFAASARAQAPQVPGRAAGNPADPATQVDYDGVIDEIVAETPQDMAPVGNVEAICPYCNTHLKSKPLKKKKCPKCRNEIQVTRRPTDGLRVLATDEQVDLLEVQAYIESGEYEKQIWLLKERMKRVGASGEKYWRCDAGIDARSVPVEAFYMHGKVVAVGSPEERDALAVLCIPRCIGMPVPFHGDPRFETMDDYYTSQRYERALEVYQTLPKSRKNSEYARELRRILG
ncbi:hypothetical protein [Methanofollis sp. W23]|uniref:hypothetical protein n=1 Tax=Methanofollis sp. W23 TaxID=2817849 RepID=UPI001AE87544|nr:hypothetical protein [Methanofollis sp. W23]